MNGKKVKNIAKVAIIAVIFLVIALHVHAQAPWPHPVTGFVFLSDGGTQAPDDTNVRINDTDSGFGNETVTGEGPLESGEYECSVTGNTGDNVTVLAWNASHYGKNDTIVLTEGPNKNANVTMNILKTGDADGDDLENFDEDYIHGTDPYNSDTDGGGEKDGSEVAAGRDPLDPSDDVTEAPPGPPVAVPEFNVIGLLALIGILSVVLAFATPRRKK